jgi:hypothetical protein
MLYFLVWIGLALLVAKFAENKSLGVVNALVISLILSPLIGLIFVLVSSEKKVGPEQTLPHKAIIVEAEKAEFRGDKAKALDLYLDALYQVKKYQFQTSGHQQAQATKITELEEKVVSLGGRLPYEKS